MGEQSTDLTEDLIEAESAFLAVQRHFSKKQPGKFSGTDSRNWAARMVTIEFSQDIKLLQIRFKLTRGLEVYGYKTQTACGFDVGE
jgi:hypothetical protein